MNPDIVSIISNAFFSNLLPVVGSAVTAIFGLFLNNVRKKVKVQKGVAAQQALDKVITDVVDGISQTVVSEIKNARRKLKPQDVETVRNIALNDTKAITADSVLKDVRAVVDDVDGYILSEVEAKVGQQKLIEMKKKEDE
jgi:hypothetical protein